VVLDGSLVAYQEIAAAIEEIPGVVAHGLVLHPRVIAVVAGPSGPQIFKPVRIKGAFESFTSHPNVQAHISRS
jgi:hypothetical protein